MNTDMMKNIFPLLKVSAKMSFRKLREEGPFDCPYFDKPVHVTKKFFRHISLQSDKRTLSEVFRRLIIVPLVEDILLSGFLSESRQKDDVFFHKISKLYSNIAISLVVIETRKAKLSLELLSCFQDQRIKKDLS